MPLIVYSPIIRKKIDKKIDKTKKTLFENFDEDVVNLLKVTNEKTEFNLNRYEQWLHYFVLSGCADEFVHDENNRYLHNGSYYNLNWKECGKYNDHFLRKDHYIIEETLNNVLKCTLGQAYVAFNYSDSPRIFSYLENLSCKKGIIKLQKLIHKGFETQEYLLHTAILDDKTVLEINLVEKIFELPSSIVDNEFFEIPEYIEQTAIENKEKILADIDNENKRFFLDECNKLNSWGEDMKDKLQEDLKLLDKAIKDIKKDIQMNEELYSLEEIIAKQEEVKKLTKERTRKRATMFDEEDRIEEEVSKLQAETKMRMNKETVIEEVFTIRFEVI